MQLLTFFTWLFFNEKMSLWKVLVVCYQICWNFLKGWLKRERETHSHWFSFRNCLAEKKSKKKMSNDNYSAIEVPLFCKINQQPISWCLIYQHLMFCLFIQWTSSKFLSNQKPIKCTLEVEHTRTYKIYKTYNTYKIYGLRP